MNNTKPSRYSGVAFFVGLQIRRNRLILPGPFGTPIFYKMLNHMQKTVSQCLIRHLAICGLLILSCVFFFTSCIKWSIPIPPPPGSTGTITGDSMQGSYDTSYSVLWQTTVASSGQTTGFIQTSDGGFVSAGQGSNDAQVFRLDAARNLLWQKNLGGTYYSGGWSVAATSDGGFVTAGFTQANDGDATDNHGGYDAWIFKLDANGNVVWKHCMGGTGDDQFFNVIVNSDGTIMAAGQTNSNNDDVTGNHGGTDLWLVKLDANGNKLWTKCYGGSGNDYTGTIEPTSDGGFILTGSSASSDGDIPGNNGGFDIVLLKLDASGNKQWAENYGGPGDESNSATIVGSDGSFAVAGSTDENGGDVSGYHGAAGNHDFWIIKTNSTGALLWQSTQGGSDDEEALGLVATSDGGYMASGFTYSADFDPTLDGGRDAWLVKVSSTGKLVWQKAYGGGGMSNVLSEWLITAADGGIVSGGAAASSWLFEIK